VQQGDLDVPSNNDEELANEPAKFESVPPKWSRQAYELSQAQGFGGTPDEARDTPLTPTKDAVGFEEAGPNQAEFGETAGERNNANAAEQCQQLPAEGDSTVPKGYSSVPGLIRQNARTTIALLTIVLLSAITLILLKYKNEPALPSSASVTSTSSDSQKLAALSSEIDKNPKDTRLYFERASIYYHLDEGANALSDLNKAIALDPKFYEAYGMRADLEGYLGQYNQAKVDAKKAIQAEPSASWAYLRAARVENFMGQFDQALVDAQHAYRLNKGEIGAYGESAAALAGLGKFEEACQWYTRQLSAAPSWKDHICVVRGGIKLHQHDFVAAIADENEALKIEPRFGAAFLVRACAEAEQGQNAEADADIANGLALATNPASAHLLAGDAYRAAGRFDQAIDEYSRSIAIYPTGMAGYRNRGCSYYRTGHLQNALDDLQIASKYSPTCSSLSYLAVVEQALGLADKADRDITRGLHSTVLTSVFYSNRASIWLQRARPDQAFADAEKALSMDKYNADAMQMIGLALVAQGKNDQGQQYLDKAKQFGYPRSIPPICW